MDKYIQEIQRLQRLVQENPSGRNTLAAISQMRHEMDEIKDNMWLVEHLTVEAMIKKPQHFKELFESCKQRPIDINDKMTLLLLMELGMG